MGTRGYIAVLNEDGSCDGFFNHWDNYPEGTGLDLITNTASITGDIHAVQKVIDNDREIEHFEHWSGAFNAGNGCDWFYLRKGAVWFCTCYYGKDLSLITVPQAIINELKSQWAEDNECYEKHIAELEKKRGK